MESWNQRILVNFIIDKLDTANSIEEGREKERVTDKERDSMTYKTFVLSNINIAIRFLTDNYKYSLLQ